MFWNKKPKEEQVQPLSERDRRILELVSDTVAAIDNMAKLHDKQTQLFKSVDLRLKALEKQVPPIHERQDTLIKLFMEYADRVLALTSTK